MATQTTSIRLPKELSERYSRLAEATGRTRSYYITEALGIVTSRMDAFRRRAGRRLLRLRRRSRACAALGLGPALGRALARARCLRLLLLAGAISAQHGFLQAAMIRLRRHFSRQTTTGFSLSTTPTVRVILRL